MAKSVVIVGGSIAGLIHGLQHKRLGNNVTILEQETGERHSHHAGIGVLSCLDAFLSKYNRTGITPVFTCNAIQYAYCRRPNFLTTTATHKLTNWGLMQRILRANFDGTVSAACPQPPPDVEGDGVSTYLAGKRVTALVYSDKDESVTIHYTDIDTGKQESIDADLAIGADGIHSTVRQLVRAPHIRRYAGYIAWRGTLPEKMVSPEALEYFSDRMTFNISKRAYLICYPIPTEDGCLERGERLLNWVCYYNVPDGSPAMTDIFIDVHGKPHQNTVPRGLVNPDVWKRVREDLQICDFFREVVEKTPNPFVTKVNDVICDTASFYGGKVVLVGDAFTTLRPNLGAASEQAAFHSSSLEEVYRGGKTQSAWDAEVRLYAKRLILLNNVVADIGRGTFFSLLMSVFAFFLFDIKQRFWSR